MGYNIERNQGIVECFIKTGITNSSLMVNGEASEHAAHLALKHGLPTGLHFNITEGIPVRPDFCYKTLTDSKGHFLGMLGLRQAVAEGKIDVTEVKEELTRQIARYTELTGSIPVYVDGHQHAHIIPGLVETFALTLLELGVRATRLPSEFNLEQATWVGDPLRQFFFMVNSNAEDAKPVLRKYNIWFSDAFYGLMTMGSNMTPQRLQSGILQAFTSLSESLDTGQPITCELMTHPGYACKGRGGCGEGADDFSQSADREYEKNILESEEMRNFYKANNIVLASYHSRLQF